jgi:hypothetical protein
MSWEDREDTTIYKVVVNNEEQYSMARRPRERAWLERRGQIRPEGRVPGLHQGSLDGYAPA